jgi:hypothetical protein
METYTLLSEEGEEAVLNALPLRYPMTLNREDMKTVVKALGVYARQYDNSGEAMSLYSSIAASVGIELI